MNNSVKLKESASRKDAASISFFSRTEILVLFALIALCIILVIARPDAFPTVKNIFNILRQFSLIAILAVGMGLVIITAGIDLSIGATIALSACFGCWIARELNAPPIIVLFAMLGTGVLIGLLNGLLIAKVGITPFIVTLGMQSIVRGSALLVSGGAPITYKPTWVSALGGAYIGEIPVAVIVMVVVVIIGWLFSSNTLTGRNIYAVGNSPKAAMLSGIRVDRIIILVYVITGFLAGLCGLLLVGQMNSADPSFGNRYEMDVVAAVVIGGISMLGGEGKIIGIIIGAALMGVLRNMFVMLMVSAYWQSIILGLVIIGAVAIDSIRKKRTTV